ncbi:MAG: hypothetical protein AAF939_17440, partial [Planctomycetota bacterium]
PSTMDPAMIEKLKGIGEKYLKDMSPEKQEQMRDLARKAFSNSNSPEGRAADRLMDQMGIPPAVRQRLKEQYKNSQSNSGQAQQPFEPQTSPLKNSADRSRFNGPDSNSDLAVNDDPFNVRKSQNQADSDTTKIDSQPKNSRDRNSSPLSRDQIERMNNGNKVRDGQAFKDDFDLEAFSNESTNRDNKDGEERPTVGPESSKKDSPMRGRSKNDQSGSQRQGLEQQSTGKLIESLRTNPDAETIKELAKRIPDLKKMVSSGTGNTDRQSSSGIDPEMWQQLQKALVEMGSQAGADEEQLKSLKQLLDRQSNEKTSSSNSGVENSGRTKRSAKTWLERAKETLSGESQKQKSKPKDEKIGNLFDRMLVESAKSVGAKNDSSTDSGVTGVVNSLFDKVINEVHESLDPRNRKNRDFKSAKKANRKKDQTASNSRNGSAASSDGARGLFNRSGSENENSGWANSSSGGNSNDSDSGGGFSSASSLTGALPTVQNLPWNQIIFGFGFLAVLITIAVITIQLQFRTSEELEQPFVIKSKLANSIRTPSDLIEAFDYFLLSKFGAKSDWWNARRAEKILTKKLPDYSSEIGCLVNDYEVARYTDRKSGFAKKVDHRPTIDKLMDQKIDRRTSEQS